MIETQDVQKATRALEDAYSGLRTAKSNLEKVCALNHQTGYNITISGVTIAVAEMDQQTYQAKLIRGCEMMHLGALKALQAKVDQWADYVTKCEANLQAQVVRHG